MQQRGCCRDNGGVPLKPSLRPGRIAHSDSHVPMQHLQGSALLRQEEVMGRWSLTDRKSRDCACLFCFRYWKTVQGDHAVDGPTWSSRAFSDPHLGCCELSEQISAHTWGAELGSGRVTCSKCCIHLANVLTLKSWLG